jgi:hypothetical protein
MEADGESRLLAIRRLLASNSKLSGTLQEKLRSTLVTVDVIHGVTPAVMGQLFADLNGKGVMLTKNETEGLNIRDPWVRATKEIFDTLSVPLVKTGRQITAVNRSQHKHLIIGQAVQMVRGLALGHSKAVSATSWDEVIESDDDYGRLVNAGVEWFGAVLDHFGAPTLPDGTRDAKVFSDEGLVLRAVPVKVALGVMGSAWFEVSRPEQERRLKALGDIDWKVSPSWQGIAGKVSPKTRRVDGKVETVEGEYQLAGAGAKEVGAAAVRALTAPDTPAGKSVRGAS